MTRRSAAKFLHAPRRREQGSALLTAMVAAGLLAIVVVVVSSSMGKMFGAQRAISNKQSVTEAAAILQAVAARYITTATTTGSCQGIDGTPVALGNLGAKLVVNGALPTLPANAPATAVQALARCRSSSSFTASGSGYHFCAALVPAAGTVGDSFVGAKGGFIEIAASFTNAASGLPRPCATYALERVGPNLGSTLAQIAVGTYVVASVDSQSKSTTANLQVFYVPSR